MSDRERLAFERVEIRRMPGIDAGFALDGLCPAINVICGPNASGKTSLTRALSTLLWQRSGSLSRAIVQGTFRLNDGSWMVSYDSGTRACQRDGQNADFPLLEFVDESDRYVLALHDLLLADNRDFAEAILRESTGGYDVGLAIRSLGYTPKPPMSNSLKQRLDRARSDQRDAEQQQDGLRQEERRRSELQNELRDAQEANRRVLDLERTLAYRRARATLAEAKRAFSVFPTVLATLSGGELDTLQGLRERLAEAARVVEQERLAIERAVDRRVATGLTSVLPPGTVARLRRRCDELHERIIAAQAATERRLAAEASVGVAGQAIGPDADDRRLGELDAVQFNALAGLVHRSREAHASLDALKKIAEWIPSSPEMSSDEIDERDRVAMGVRFLTSWMRQGGAPAPVVEQRAQPTSRLLVVAGVLAIVEALLLGVLAHPAFFFLFPITVILLVIGVRRPAPIASVTVVSSDADWRGEYERLGLEAPANWDLETVEKLTDELSRRLRRFQAADETRQRWQYVHDERPTAVQLADAIDGQVDRFCRQFGVPKVRDVAALHTLANAISTWQLERGHAVAAAAIEVEAQTRRDAILRSINDDLLTFGYPAAAGHGEVTSAIDDLSEREQERTEALAEERRASQHLDGHATPEFDRRQEEIRAFFERLGLTSGDDYGLRQLLDCLPEYNQAKLAANRADLELERAQTALEGIEHDDLMSIDDLELALHDAQQLSDTRESVSQEIATIDARIEQAKRGNDIEMALAAERAASDDLRDARAVGESLAAGWVLADFVQQQTRDVDRPRVFHRARDLFARITHGRYELDVDGTDPPRFRARDTLTGTGHALDELSSGTRVQLLLAVRVAFVEQQERGPMLPLILDETLGNSDEYRARAIIDATVQIAREGRQILYLTAQHDEVRKWQAIMADCQDVPFALIDLAEVRGLSDWERLPLATPQSWQMPVAPAPNGHDRETYGQLLHVPGIDLSACDPGSIHLWHLIDDPAALHAHLRVQIETWGQLRTLSEYGGVVPLADDPLLIEQCRARSQVIEAIAESWQIGRGRPVDRAVLLDSEAVSEVFLDRTADLAAALDGDASALLDALEAGQLHRFHATSRQRLQAYFEEHGYIDPSPPLTLSEARARVFARVSPAIASGVLTFDWVNQMLSTLWLNIPDREPDHPIASATTLS